MSLQSFMTLPEIVVNEVWPQAIAVAMVLLQLEMLLMAVGVRV